jgi:polyhydroxyalkanoate synthase
MPYQLLEQLYLIDLCAGCKKIWTYLRLIKPVWALFGLNFCLSPDSPDQAGEAYRQFMKDFYQGNKLIQSQVEIGNQRVDLRNIRIPIFNIYAEQDHLVPPASSLALKTYIASEDYTWRSFPVGHIGMYVSSKVQRNLPPTIVDWLKARA